MNNNVYAEIGVSDKVYALGEKVLNALHDRFEQIDQTAEYNQAKVIAAMQKNRVNATCFAATSGYGYNDVGRDTLEQVYADTFHTEAALVRPQITCGTHALAVALSANLLPGDELYSPVGRPYDTLEEVIGIRESACSLAEYGVTYSETPLLPDGSIDYDSIFICSEFITAVIGRIIIREPGARIPVDALHPDMFLIVLRKLHCFLLLSAGQDLDPAAFQLGGCLRVNVLVCDHSPHPVLQVQRHRAVP